MTATAQGFRSSAPRSTLSDAALRARRDESASGVRQRHYDLAPRHDPDPTLVDFGDLESVDQAPATERSPSPPEGCEGTGPVSVTKLGAYGISTVVTSPPLPAFAPAPRATLMTLVPLYDSSSDPVVLPLALPFAWAGLLRDALLEAGRSIVRALRRLSHG